MRAYVHVNSAPMQTINGTRMGWTAEVVTEQDYYERGAFAHSYRTQVHEKATDAELSAVLWARDQGLALVDVERI